MKFQFKHQQFQADAARAICDLFNGQTTHDAINVDSFTIDGKLFPLQIFGNAPLEIDDKKILANLRDVQIANKLPVSKQLDGRNFSVEMETGTGKTYTYIKTMHELNERYGWNKFIVVVPSVAIREGVKKTFEVTAEHFYADYGKNIYHFVYSSKNLDVIKDFVSGAGLWAMIVNVQSFNSRTNDARRMLHALDDFGSQIPMETIAQTNPIIIIDEPQSVEGNVARRQIPKFNPLMILRYSATLRQPFNLVYRLNALDAYKKHLVKRIAVKGLEVRNDNSAGFVYLQRVNVSKQNPTATVSFKRKGATEIKKIFRNLRDGDNLYTLSNGLEEYRDGFTVTRIDGAENSLEFLNGLKLFVGNAVGDAHEESLRRLQIRETIKSHLEREAELFGRGIKVLSLFFIDEVAKYRVYDEENFPTAGVYAKIFEEEYSDAVANFVTDDAAFQKYLSAIDAHETHAGYFSVDKKNHVTNDEKDDAYNLIMRDKEKLLNLSEPVRFIFSHSTLREGWDNPNVFQICALKQSSSDVRRHQEVGRGMRLCVNQDGERQDAERINNQVYDVNVLTVVANESYQTFATSLQAEFAEASDVPLTVEPKFFVDKKLAGHNVDESLSFDIYDTLVERGYLSRRYLTKKFFDDRTAGKISFGDELDEMRDDILNLLETVGGGKIKIENALTDNVDMTLDEEKLHAETFQALWKRIRRKSFYSVDFDSDALIERAATTLNEKILVPETKISVASGTLNDKGEFAGTTNGSYDVDLASRATNLRIDFVGRLVTATGLTRRDVSEILKRLAPEKFAGIAFNPEKFLLDAAKIINGVKNKLVVDKIKYVASGEAFDVKIFVVHATGKENVNAIATEKNLYSHLISDSGVEKDFAAELEADANVSVYAKLPKKFFVLTPMGNFTPDWAIVFRDGDAEKIFFVVETKGVDKLNEEQLREVEKAKISCAKKHFAAVGDGVECTFVKNYSELKDCLRTKK